MLYKSGNEKDMKEKEDFELDWSIWIEVLCVDYVFIVYLILYIKM